MWPLSPCIKSVCWEDCYKAGWENSVSTSGLCQAKDVDAKFKKPFVIWVLPHEGHDGSGAGRRCLTSCGASAPRPAAGPHLVEVMRPVQSRDGTKMPQTPWKVGSRSEHCTGAGDKQHCWVTPPCSRAWGLHVPPAPWCWSRGVPAPGLGKVRAKGGRKKKKYLNRYLRDKEHKVPLAKGGVCLAFTRGLLFSGLQQWLVTLPEVLTSSFLPGNPTFLSRREATAHVLLKYLSSVYIFACKLCQFLQGVKITPSLNNWQIHQEFDTEQDHLLQSPSYGVNCHGI